MWQLVFLVFKVFATLLAILSVVTEAMVVPALVMVPGHTSPSGAVSTEAPSAAGRSVRAAPVL